MAPTTPRRRTTRSPDAPGLSAAPLARRALLCLPFLLAACTSTEIARVITGATPEAVSAVQVAPFEAEDEAWASYAVLARRGLLSALRESGAFAAVFDEAPEPEPPGTLRVRGEVVEVERGSRPLRAMVGFGIGQARIVADLALADARDVTLARFRITQLYGGGFGAGGPDLVSLEELAEALGQAAARRILAWAETGRIEPGVSP